MRTPFSTLPAHVEHGPYPISNPVPSRTILSVRSSCILPLDILFLILIECEVKTLLNCRLVSKTFDALVRNQKQLLYRLALALEYHVDSPLSSGSASSLQKLQRLCRQSLAWRGELPPTLKVRIPVLRRESINYELEGGVFALTDSMGGEGREMAFPSMNAPEMTSEGKRIDFLKLPSAIAGDLRMHIGSISLKGIGTVADFTTSVDMDLLVLVEKFEPAPGQDWFKYRIHMWSLSRSCVEPEPHPLAHSPTFEYEGEPGVWNYELELRLYGDHLGLLLGQTRTASGDRIVVWNWKNGEKAAKHAEEEGLESFIFLREGLILMPSFMNNSLEVYTYETSKIVGTFQATLNFFLPRPSPGLNYAFILLRTQPTNRPTYTSSAAEDEPCPYSSSKRPLGAPYTPFVPSTEDSIIICSTHVLPYPGELGAHWVNRALPDAEGTIVFKKSLLINAFEAWQRVPKGGEVRSMEELYTDTSTPIGQTTSDSAPVQPMFIPWKVWMESTRWFQGHDVPIWVRDVSGMRFAMRVRAPVSPPVSQDVIPIGDVDAPVDTQTAAIPPPNPTAPANLGFRTRICDFNVRPSSRIPHTLPYPGSIDLDLSVDYSQLAETVELTETSSYAPTEAQIYAHKNENYLKMKKEGGTPQLDNGWAEIHKQAGLEWTRRPVREETFIQDGMTYGEEIRTKLPYLEITSRSSSRCMSLMMDAERIIETKMDSNGDLMTVDVLVI